MPEIFRNLLTTGGPDSLALPTHADGPHINLPGNFHSTLEMKILDDIMW